LTSFRIFSYILLPCSNFVQNAIVESVLGSDRLPPANFIEIRVKRKEDIFHRTEDGEEAGTDKTKHNASGAVWAAEA